MDDGDVLTPFQISLVRQLVRGPLPRHVAYEHAVAITEITLMEISLYDGRWRPKTEADFDTGALWLSRYEHKELQHGCRVSYQGHLQKPETRGRPVGSTNAPVEKPAPQPKPEKKPEKLPEASPTPRVARKLLVEEQQIVDVLNQGGALMPPWAKKRGGSKYRLLLNSKQITTVPVLTVTEMIAGGILAWVKEDRFTVLRASGPYRKAS